jgi:hypothetical protein
MAITKKRIQELKKEYKRIYLLKSGDKEVIVAYPSYSVMHQAITAAATGGKTAFTQVILNNCIVEGDESIRESEIDIFNLSEEIHEVFEHCEYEKSKEGHLHVFTCDDKVFKLKPVTIEHMNLAERKATKGKHLSKEWELLNMLAVEKDEAVMAEKDAYYLFPLLMAVEELYEKRMVQVKKL